MIGISAKLQAHAQEVRGFVDPAARTFTLGAHTYTTDDVRFDVPIQGTVYGTLLNYQEELTLLGDALYDAPYNAPPKEPVLYIKPKNTHRAHRSTIPFPEECEYLETGAALGIVFERETSRVPAERALDYVAGYTIANDVSIPHSSLHRPAIKEKIRDGFCPIGPWTADRANIIHPDQLTIRVLVNGALEQTATTSSLVRPIPQLIADVSAFMTFSPGDVLFVGTPPNRPTFQRGDTVTIEIEGIGKLENRAVAEREALQ